MRGMSQIRKFLQLDSAERRLLFRAWLLLWRIRFSLRAFSFATTQQFVAQQAEPREEAMAEGFPPGWLAWAVTTTSRFVPGGRHCLTQALVTQILLGRQKIPAELLFGCLPDSTEGLKAHAWVESDGVSVIGGNDLDRYIRLSSPSDSPT